MGTQNEAFMQRHGIPYLRVAIWIATAAAIIALFVAGPGKRLTAQAPSDVAGPSAEPAPVGDESAASAPAAAKPVEKSINILQLAIAGGIFMIPITAMSVLAATMAVERLLALRKQKVLPDGLVEGLGQLAGPKGAFDPRKAYRVCQQFPSAAANVVRAMLLRVGRPLPEIETAVTQASQREADKLYANVRWLNLAASISTMLGLIGTIQGMILAFHQMTIMDAAADRTSVLADGIYTALVTTFAGLAVAIPSALFSFYFEGKIQSNFRQIEELIFNLLPQLERYEGRVRFNRQSPDGEEEPSPVAAASN
jgi:biopolymer transport protein ExbB